jgi:nucleotide-binding universal stress UspA family protein
LVIMKAILVPVEESDLLESMLTTALKVGKRFGSYIEGQYDRPSLVESWGPEGLGSAAVMESLEQQDHERALKARELFTQFMAARQVPDGSDPAAREGPSAGWFEDPSPGNVMIANRGRVFDLIVVGQPRREAVAPRMITLEAALFESGRPIMIAPAQAPAGLGETVVIAWNGSTETARTLAFAMPFLARAAKVSVIAVEEGMVPGPDAPAVARYLARNGIQAQARTVSAGKRGLGETLLDQATELGADLLVKGAYTHSRLRQMIFGGATSHILAKAQVPVFMGH